MYFGLLDSSFVRLEGKEERREGERRGGKRREKRGERREERREKRGERREDRREKRRDERGERRREERRGVRREERRENSVHVHPAEAGHTPPAQRCPGTNRERGAAAAWSCSSVVVVLKAADQ